MELRSRPSNQPAGGQGRKRELFDLLDQGLLDTAEQEELVEELKRESERQAALWRTCYGCVAVLVALFFAGTAAYQLVEPWGLKYTAEFRNTWSPLSVAVGMLVTSASCWCAAIGLLCRRLEDRTSRIRCTSSDFIKLSLCLACISAAFWSCSLWWEHHLVVRQAQLPPRFKWDLLWLPATPLAMCVLSKHVVESTSDMSLAVEGLKDKMYSYKRL